MNKNIGDMTESELKDFIIELQEENSRYERENRKLDIKFFKAKINELEDNWNKLKEYITNEPILDFYNDNLPFEIIVENILSKMKELERGVSDVED